MPLGDEGRGRHHLARRAVPALERVMLEEGPLHRVQLPVGSQSLDCGYLGVRDRHGQRHAGQYPPPSYVHRAGAALAPVATHFRAGQPQPVTQGIQQRDPRFQHHDVRAAVHPQRNFALLVEPHAANVSPVCPAAQISAHFAEIYGASVSKETISQITDKVLEKMTDWCSRPLDGVYAAILVTR